MAALCRVAATHHRLRRRFSRKGTQKSQRITVTAKYAKYAKAFFFAVFAYSAWFAVQNQ
jgi:hypothetical protein